MFNLSRKIRYYRNSSLSYIKKISPSFYKLLILIGSVFKFFYKINKKISFKNYSKNLDKINQFEFKKTSQNNEDGIIHYLIQKLGLDSLNFVEIGFDYYENNSLNLFKIAKKGLLVDGSDEKTFLLKYLLKFFYPKRNIKVINKMINKDNINQIISEQFNENDEIDLLSIDVDGVDYYIFENIKFKPKIIVIEYMFWYGKEAKCSIPYSEEFIWKQGSLYSGASLNAICSLAKSKDYHLIALESSCVNAFFIRGDYKEKFEVLDPIKSFKVPNKYNDDEIKIAKDELLSKPLVFF